MTPARRPRTFTIPTAAGPPGSARPAMPTLSVAVTVDGGLTVATKGDLRGAHAELDDDVGGGSRAVEREVLGVEDQQLPDRDSSKFWSRARAGAANAGRLVGAASRRICLRVA